MNWIQFGLGAASALALSFLLHTVDVNRIEKLHTQELNKQAARLEQLCTADQNLTKGKNDEIKRNYDDVNRQLAIYKRMHPANCVIPAPARQAELGQSRQGHAAGNGAVTGSTDDFRDYGAECELIRRDFKTCTSFVDAVWVSRGQ